MLSYFHIFGNIVTHLFSYKYSALILTEILMQLIRDIWQTNMKKKSALDLETLIAWGCLWGSAAHAQNINFHRSSLHQNVMNGCLFSSEKEGSR